MLFQPPLQAKTVVEYKLDEAPPGRKPPPGVKVGIALPYGNPQEIQMRQKEMQQRKEDEREKEELERERVAREQERIKKMQEEREEAERLEKLKREQERQRIERERQERERMDREQQERQRRKMEEERQKREKEDAERKRREEWEKKEQEKKERERKEEAERRRQEEEWKKKQEQERLQREKEEHDQRKQEENPELDELSRRERELQMILEQKRREKEKRLRELELQIQKEREESEKEEQELIDRLKREREERKESLRISRPSDEQQQRVTRASVGSTQVHYVNTPGYENDKNEVRTRPVRAPTPANDNRSHPSERPNRPIDYSKKGPGAGDENRGTPPLGRRHPVSHEDNRGNYNPGKNPTLQDSKEDSFDMVDHAEVERQFQQRLAQETAGRSEVDGGNVKVIRVPIHQDNLEPRGNSLDETRGRARVDWQREEEERNRKEQQLRREQDEQLVRDIQLNESLRQQPPGGIAEPIHPQMQADWGKEEELRRQREEDDRLREARANQLRNRNIQRYDDDDDEDVRDTSYNGRTRRVKFATVRTEIIQPSPNEDKAKPGVKFVHDGKVIDSDEEEFPHPPPPMDDDNPPQHPPPPQDQTDYYQRPPPPPKPQNLISNGSSKPPEYHGGPIPAHYRENEHIVRVRPRVSDEGYATYPGRQQSNNNFPVPKPRGGVSTEFTPDNSKLPFNDKMKVFNETTPPKRQTTSKWEQRLVNGDSL